MDGYRADTYGDAIAGVHDDWFPLPDDVGEAVALVRREAPGDRVLELGCGIGHYLLGFAAAGMRAAGIEGSAAMADRLRRKPHGDRVDVTVGDFVDVAVAGPFDAVTLFSNTFTNLTSAAEQRRCLRGVRRVLADGGVLVVAGFVADPAAYAGGQALRVVEVGIDEVVLQVARYDEATQVVDGATVVLSDTGVRLHPVCARNVDPDELDAMAREAGLVPSGRRADLAGAPFDADSTTHVSVYRAEPAETSGDRR